jgi:hypothetical protein
MEDYRDAKGNIWRTVMPVSNALPHVKGCRIHKPFDDIHNLPYNLK